MNEYLDWTELLEDAEPKPAQALDFESSTSAKPMDALLAMDDVSDDLKALIRRHQTLAQEMDRLTGKAPEAADEWDSKRFPMPNHTAASRLADRKAARQATELAAKRKHQLEIKQIAQRKQQQAELKAQKLKLSALLNRKRCVQKNLERFEHLARLRKSHREQAQKHEQQRAAKKAQQLEVLIAKNKRLEEDRARYEARQAYLRQCALERLKSNKQSFEDSGSISKQQYLLARRAELKAQQKAQEQHEQRRATLALQALKKKRQQLAQWGF